jgi:signal transduction histidine kinase
MEQSQPRLSDTVQNEKEYHQNVIQNMDNLEDLSIAKRATYHNAEDATEKKISESTESHYLVEYDKTRDHMVGTYERREREASATFDLVEEERKNDMDQMLHRLTGYVSELENRLEAGRCDALARLIREKDRNASERTTFDANMRDLSASYRLDMRILSEASDRADKRRITRSTEEDEDAKNLARKREWIQNLNTIHENDVEHERQMNVLIRTICHEVRNPLQGIISNAEYIYREIGTDKCDAERVRRSVGDIITCSMYQSQVLNDLINFESLRSHSLNTILEYDVSVDNIIALSASSFKETCRQKGIVLHVGDTINTIGTFHASSVRTILMNLIGNAAKFTQHGSITITPGLGEEINNAATMRISVADTGPGIDDDIKDRIFHQYGIHSREKQSGSGIGLHICDQRIKSIGGTITFTTILGKGTEFVFTFPITNISKGDIPTLEVPLNIDRVTKCNLLIAEDSVLLQRIYGIMLEDVHGFTVAFDGQEAIQLLKESIEKKPYDLILLDYHMPHMAGLECAQIIRDMGCLIPIVFVTGEIGRDIREEISHITNCDILIKPIRRNELLAYIQDKVKKK